MNFGAIGSIIGHEITHAFDDQSSKLETWSDASVKAYQKRVQCIVDQYSSYRVKEVEELLMNENVQFFINGNFTQKESEKIWKINKSFFQHLKFLDIADCGGLKLAFKAYKRYESLNPESVVVPIGLQEYNREKIFWLSFAQTYCRLVHLSEKKKKQKILFRWSGKKNLKIWTNQTILFY